MAHIVTNINGIGVLSADKLPDNTANPFKNSIEFLDKASGRFWHEYYVTDSIGIMANSQKRQYKNQGRKFIEKFLSDEKGKSPEGYSDLYISPWFRSSLLSLQQIAGAEQLFTALNSAGAEIFFDVVDYPVFITVANANYSDQVPSYMPNRTYINEEEVEVVKTWEQWKATNNTYRSNGSEYYIPTRAYGSKWLATSVLLKLINDGYTLTDFANYPANTEDGSIYEVI